MERRRRTSTESPRAGRRPFANHPAQLFRLGCGRDLEWATRGRRTALANLASTDLGREALAILSLSSRDPRSRRNLSFPVNFSVAVSIQNQHGTILVKTRPVSIDAGQFCSMAMRCFALVANATSLWWRNGYISRTTEPGFPSSLFRKEITENKVYPSRVSRSIAVASRSLHFLSGGHHLGDPGEWARGFVAGPAAIDDRP